MSKSKSGLGISSTNHLTKPHSFQLKWTAERYFDEVRAVRDGLGLKKYHLIGPSWGTILGEKESLA